MNRKVLFIDVDGTLVGKTNTVPPSARKAIEEASNNGHLIFICTGRSKAEINEDISSCKLNGMIGGNGSYIEINNEAIFHKVLSLDDTKGIVDFLYEKDLGFYLEANSGLYPSKHYQNKIKERLSEKDKSLFDVFFNSLTDTSTYNKEDYYRNDIAKISYLLNNEQDSLDFKDKFPDLKHNTWSVGTALKHGDVGISGINKKFAVEYLINYLKINKEDTISFGDEGVDIPMFEATSIGIAMGNASKDLKEKATYITTDTDEDGLYNAFKYLKLI